MHKGSKGEGLRPFLFFLLIAILVFPQQVFAADDVSINDFYSLELPMNYSGTHTFYSKDGSGSFTFPAPVKKVYWNKENNSSSAAMVCEAGGQSYTVAYGSIGKSFDPPITTIRCTGTGSDKSSFKGYIVSADGVDGKHYVLGAKGTDTPPKGDGGSGGSGSGGGTGGSGGTDGSGGSGTDINSNYYYVGFRDEYRVDYDIPPNATRYGLYFTSPSGTPHSVEYDFPPTGIHYLNCNGTYFLKFYDSAGKVIGQTTKMNTSAIKSPMCKSYSDGISGSNDLSANYDGEKINWNDNGSDRYEVYKDGQMITETTDTNYPTKEKGSYTILGKKNGQQNGQSDLNVSGDSGGSGTDTPPVDGGQCAGGVCDVIGNILECPGWHDMLGDLSSIIPPPPNWDEVAGVFRDKIVPAMGQELVNRSPEIAKIIADEFESREKPVHPPPPLPDFKPSVPKLNDIPAPIEGNLTENVPDFTPDYSESKPFSIPDPMDLVYDNNDKGYEMPKSQDLSSPNYKKTEKIELDKGYKTNQPDVVTPPKYEVKNPINDKPMPEYKTEQKEDKPPDYHVQNKPAPNYKHNEKPMPDYVVDGGR